MQPRNIKMDLRSHCRSFHASSLVQGAFNIRHGRSGPIRFCMAELNEVSEINNLNNLDIQSKTTYDIQSNWHCKSDKQVGS